MTPLLKIKAISNYKDDDRINALIEMTQGEIINICKLEEYLEELDNVLVEMVIVKLNKIGQEGLNSISISGVSESYLDQYPKSILDRLAKYTKVVRFK